MALFRRNSLGPLLVAMSLAALLGFGVVRGLHATDDMRSHLDLFSQVLYLVQNNYVEVPDNEKLIKGAIDGMLKTLDPHTVHLPVQRAQRMDEEFQGEYSGVGIQFELRDGAIVVIAALEGGPSYRLGIQAGDRIVEIDSKPLPKTITNDDVFKMLRGLWDIAAGGLILECAGGDFWHELVPGDQTYRLLANNGRLRAPIRRLL